MSRRPLRLATILSHPDDETFGVGGTLIKYTDAGVECHSLSLTQGEAGNGDPTDPIPRERLGAVRAEELAESGRRMGLASTTCFTYPDGGASRSRRHRQPRAAPSSEPASRVTAYMATLAVSPHHWTADELGAAIDIRAVADRKWHATQAHRSQQPDLDRLAQLRDAMVARSRPPADA